MTIEDVSEDGKVPVERERLTILQIVGEIEEDTSLSRLVGIRSRSQILIGHLKLDIFFLFNILHHDLVKLPFQFFFEGNLMSNWNKYRKLTRSQSAVDGSVHHPSGVMTL